MGANPTQDATASTASAAPTAAAPTASAPAARQVLIYDGDCDFCVRRARWFQRKSRRQALPYQQLDLAEIGLSEDAAARQAVWIDSRNRRFYGHRAAAKSLIHIGGIWGVAGRIMLVPPFSWLARLIYRLVADNRHRL